MSVFTDRLVAKASAHSDPLECISGNGVPTVRGVVGVEEVGGGARRPPSPVLFCPSRASLFLLSSSVLCLWSFNGVVDHVQGGVRGGGAGRGCWWGGGRGHCRRSSVSDRENAITTSSAPWSMLCCGSWLI